MPFPSEAVANYFLEVAQSSGKTLSPMKLQKLVYFAHGWHLGLTGNPLIDEQVQAWSYGPVIRSLYNAFREFGRDDIVGLATELIPCEGKSIAFRTVTPRLQDVSDAEQFEATISFLDRIWDVYSVFSAIQLSNMTHASGTPWDQINRKYNGKIPKYATIPDEVIRSYFGKEAASHG